MDRKPPRPLNLDAAGVPHVAAEVLAAMTPWLGEAGARAEGLHGRARAARSAIEDARAALGGLVGIAADRVLLTSGAAESLLQLLRAAGSRPRDGVLVFACPENDTTVIAAAVRTTARERGADFVLLPVDREGVLPADAVGGAPCVLALSGAHPVLGTVQDVGGIARRLAASGGALAVDATWLLGREPLRLDTLAGEVAAFADLAPIGVPFGLGVSFLPEGLEIPPLFAGGLEQDGRRAGPVPAALAVAAGTAARRIASQFDRRAATLRESAARLGSGLVGIPGVVRLGPSPRARIAGHVAVAVPGLRSDALVLALSDRGILASPGSPCGEAGLPAASLLASGLPEAIARTAVVLAMPADGPLSETEIEHAVAAFAAAIASLRAVAGARG